MRGATRAIVRARVSGVRVARTRRTCDHGFWRILGSFTNAECDHYS